MCKFHILIILCFLISETHAQQAVLTGGGDAESTSGKVSYSVGQVDYLNYFGSNGSSAEGVQQPFEISVITDLQDSHSQEIDLSTYPNPVADDFTLRVTPFRGERIEYRVLDSSGKQVHEGDIIAESTSIDSRQWSNGQYVVQLSAPIHQSIRIVKIQ